VPASCAARTHPPVPGPDGRGAAHQDQERGLEGVVGFMLVAENAAADAAASGSPLF
jgi:hypothetical protein